MSDSVDKTKRSEVMRAVKSKGNKSTELKLIKLFKENGIKGWRRGIPLKAIPISAFLRRRRLFLLVSKSAETLSRYAEA